MARVTVGERSFEVSAFVFDKDGLLFESKQFWIALAEERMEKLRRLGSEELVKVWARAFGVKTEDGIRTEAHDPALLEDPSLIIYHPVRVVGDDTIVTNGDQTDTVMEV